LIVVPDVMDDRFFAGVNIFVKRSVTFTSEPTK